MGRKGLQRSRNGSRGARDPGGWARFSDERLLDLRFKDLGLTLEDNELEFRVDRLYGELERRGLRFRPHVWLSNEWFSPDGIPGIAIPFYLAHPRLAKLEARQMLEVEGGTEAACMRVLRHEAGHAIDSAYRLHFKRSWRETFGKYSEPYPKAYRPKPSSRNFVLHLDSWYAQAHPAEDFAETFAVWLTPRSRWRRAYSEWPVALKKLQYIEDTMLELRGQRPRVQSRRRIEPLSQLTMTLREHYRQKREWYGVEWPDIYDRQLRMLFSDEKRYARRPTAASFLRGLRNEIRSSVARWTGAHPYTIDQVLLVMIERCRQLKLRMATSKPRARTQAVLLLTVHTMNCLQKGRQEIPL